MQCTKKLKKRKTKKLDELKNRMPEQSVNNNICSSIHFLLRE